MKTLSQPQFNYNDAKVESSQILYKGYFQLQQYKIRFKLFGGGWSKIITRELLCRNQCVVVLPYDPDLDAVVLLEQFRIGAIESRNNACHSPWLYEVVAGVVEANETVDEVVVRETQEEAGLEIKSLIPIMNYWASPGGSNEYSHCFCGIVDAKNAGGLHGIAEESEDIKVHVVSTQDAFAMLDKGLIANAHSIIALQWLKINREKLTTIDR